eukprot:364818-Chlamydomonas_euryale.AAC.26
MARFMPCLRDARPSCSSRMKRICGTSSHRSACFKYDDDCSGTRPCLLGDGPTRARDYGLLG